MVVSNIAAMLNITSKLGFLKVSNLNLFRAANPFLRLTFFYCLLATAKRMAQDLSVSFLVTF